MAKAKVNTAAQPTLEPLDPLGQRFLEYFHHGWGFIYAPTPKSGERPQWQTETRYPLQPRNLWQQYLNPDVLIGLRFTKQTNYLLIDIDRGSQLHPSNSQIKYRQLLASLEEIGLCRPIPIQSSDSGGLHIYYFLEEKQHSYTLACAIQQTLEAAGFKIKGGELEIFPNCKVYSKGSPSNFNAHRLPLQTGSYVLDDCLEPWSDDIEDFLNAADWSAKGQDYEALAQALVRANSKKIIKFPYRQRSAAEQWKQDLEQRISEGWTGNGQTNELLKDIACYGIVFRQLSGQTLVDHIVITACQSPGYVNWCRHQHEIEQRAKEWARCCEGFYTPYPGTPQRVNSYKEQFGRVDENKIINLHPNEQRQQETIGRIRSIVAQLQQALTFPERTSDRALAIIAASKAQYGKGVSQTTLHKAIYLPLWHPDHQKNASKQPVNELLDSNTAILYPEKYPQIPDPWLEESQSETQTKQGIQEQTAKIYTLPPYMKVLYLSSAKALPPATPIAELNQIQESSQIQIQIQIQEFSPSFNSSDPSFNSSEISNFTNHKQNLYQPFRSESFDDNKQDLSNEETITGLGVSDVVTTDHSDVDSTSKNTLQGEYTSEAEPFAPVSIPTTTHSNVGCVDSLPIPVEADDPLEQQTFSPDDYRQAIRLKLQATAQARHWLKLYCTIENLSFLPQERIKLEKVAMRLLMLESPSLILQQEAQEWLASNPSALEMAERLKQSRHDYRL
ncbi:hypothetical protein [Nostoc punctiforme]|uniref:Uncharacterized protein n=1 Tax=Nostoc punctiforme (strain ATCC 29133 / PCC 73102) TaxID=63737 RepID=B2JBR7_NOSP7|nr:hypothetical protein [Nostoc punctiforme]ACC85371.1 conserved hypothetical protein [Nostoc punctiforme PCC 73102]